MATSVTLPALGESVTEGTITRWLKQPGDKVEVDEPLLEVSTDKVDTEIPSPVAGTLIEVKVAEDETVEVGAELCTVGDEGESGGSGADSEDASESDEEPDDAASDTASDQDEQSAKEAPAAEASGDNDTDGQEPKQTEPQGDVPAAQTEGAPPEQETAAASSDTKPEMESSTEPTTSGGAGTPVTLPALGESVTEGTVTRWLKQVGDDVAVDEPLLEVSTDKVDTEIPSPVAGKLLEIKVDEDETVEVGAELATIGSEDTASSDGGGSTSGGDQSEAAAEEDAASADGAPSATTQADGAEAPPSPTPETAEPQPDSGAEATTESDKDEAEEAAKQPATQQAAAEKEADTDVDVPSSSPSSGSSGGGGDGGAYVTPLVRKMAAEQDVDLSSLEGTGVGGRIRKQDVLDAAKSQKAAKDQPAAASAPSKEDAAATAPTPSPLRGKTEPLSRLRKVIAKRMIESLQTSAQLTTVVEVDITAISRLRDSVKDDFLSREGVKLSFMPFFAKAAIDALKAHPSLNAAIDTEKGEVTYYDRENLAIAVDTEKGLLTPVIKDAGDLSIAGLARKIADIADRTRRNKIGPDELAGGTFTLTNTGSRGALFDTPIINQPQVAILGTGSVVKRAVVIDDANLGETIAVRRMMYLALTYDHRLVDGADAARFLTEVKGRLEAGQFEV